MKYFLFIGSLLLLFTACGSSKKTVTTTRPATTRPAPVTPKGVKFMKSDKLMPVLAAAKEEKKLVFVDFYTTWCTPCKLMDEDVFSNEEFGDFMNDNFISYKVDAEKGGGPDLALIYQVFVFPTLIFLDTDGKVLVRKNGAAYPTELKSMANQAVLENERNGE